MIPTSCDSVVAHRRHGQVHTHKTVLLPNDWAGCDGGGPRGPVHTERGKLGASASACAVGLLELRSNFLTVFALHLKWINLHVE